jgi:hypothetical protein
MIWVDGARYARTNHPDHEKANLAGATSGIMGTRVPSRSNLRPGRRDETPRHGSIGWIRPWTEPVNDTLNGQLGLERHGGRTTQGVCTRITQRLLAMAAAIWHNWATAEHVRRSLTAYDHRTHKESLI